MGHQRRLARLRDHAAPSSSSYARYHRQRAATVELPPPEPLGPEEAEVLRRAEEEGTRRALALGNRFPLRFDSRSLDEVHQAFERSGFCVLSDVVEAHELHTLTSEFEGMLARAPVREGEATAADGRPAFQPEAWSWAEALGDPTGGRGRAPAQMRRFPPPPGHEARVISGSGRHLAWFEAGLRLYAHPKLLRLAAYLLGEDFTRFNEGLQIKLPRVGPSVAWHQDGTTHWAPDGSALLSGPQHGFNIQVLLYGSNAVNGVWFLPGSHRTGRCDIAAMVESSGSDRIEGTVPVIAAPGEVAIFDRNILHASFPNRSSEPRVSVGFGFHPRSSVLGAKFREQGEGPLPAEGYSAEDVRRRSEVIPLAIATRAAYYPSETPHHYPPAPLDGVAPYGGDAESWTEEARAAALAEPMLAT